MKESKFKTITSAVIAVTMLASMCVPSYAYFNLRYAANNAVAKYVNSRSAYALTAPDIVKQKKSGFCFAACLQSLDNMWGGTYTQDDSGINQSTGYVSSNNSIVRWTDGEASYAGIKKAIDDGSYCLVYMTGKYNHWVVAYEATGASASKINVMDPYNGELITLERAMQIESATTISQNRVAYKYS